MKRKKTHSTSSGCCQCREHLEAVVDKALVYVWANAHRRGALMDLMKAIEAARGKPVGQKKGGAQ